MQYIAASVWFPAGAAALYSADGSSQVCRTVAVVPTTAQTLFSATFARKLFPHFAQARPGADSIQALL